MGVWDMWPMLFVWCSLVHIMSSLSLARHVHLVVRHAYRSIHGMMVLSCGWLLILPTFVSV